MKKDKLFNVLSEARYSFESCKEDLVSKIEIAIGELQRALCDINMKDGGYPNPLGILQRTGQDVDRLAALFYDRKNYLETLEKIEKELNN